MCEIQGVKYSSCSASLKIQSPCSTSPLMYLVLQVPHKPDWHEVGTSIPTLAKASMIDSALVRLIFWPVLKISITISSEFSLEIVFTLLSHSTKRMGCNRSPGLLIFRLMLKLCFCSLLKLFHFLFHEVSTLFTCVPLAFRENGDHPFCYKASLQYFFFSSSTNW